MPSSRGSSPPRDQIQVSCIAGGFFTIWATKEAHNKGLCSTLCRGWPQLVWSRVDSAGRLCRPSGEGWGVWLIRAGLDWTTASNLIQQGLSLRSGLKPVPPDCILNLGLRAVAAQEQLFSWPWERQGCRQKCRDFTGAPVWSYWQCESQGHARVKRPSSELHLSWVWSVCCWPWPWSEPRSPSLMQPPLLSNWAKTSWNLKAFSSDSFGSNSGQNPKSSMIFLWAHTQSLSRVCLFVTPWTVAYQAPLSMGFSRQEFWSGLPFPSPPREQSFIFCIDRWILYHWAIKEEKGMAPHSSTLAWKIPWTEEPGRLQSMGSLGVGHDWTTSLSLFTCMHWRRKWQPTPVFLPGESQGWGSLVGCRLWGCTESDTTEVT